MGREATDSLLRRAVTVRNPLYNESSWCVPPSSGEKKKRGTGGRKEAARRRTRARPLLHESPLLFRGFSALIPPRARRKEVTLPPLPEKGRPRRGHVSRPGHLPLKRTHCYVPIISFTLAASHLSFSPFVFFLLPAFSSATCLPFASLCLGTSSCPFPLRTKALRTYAPALRGG